MRDIKSQERRKKNNLGNQTIASTAAAVFWNNILHKILYIYICIYIYLYDDVTHRTHGIVGKNTGIKRGLATPGSSKLMDSSPRLRKHLSRKCCPWRGVESNSWPERPYWDIRQLVRGNASDVHLGTIYEARWWETRILGLYRWMVWPSTSLQRRFSYRN